MVFYLGDKTTLGHYANTELLDGDPHKIEVADTTPDAGFDANSARAYPANQGRPVRTEHVPTRIEWQELAPVPDVEIQHGMVVVPERFREIVEQFEPGVHQFLPVAYIDRAGEFLAQRYYFVPCNRLDSVDRVNTTGFVLWRNARWMAVGHVMLLMPESLPEGVNPSLPPKMVFSAAQIGDKHAWCDMYMPLTGPKLSDALGAALQAEHFSGIALPQAETV